VCSVNTCNGERDVTLSQMQTVLSLPPDASQPSLL
jgi:hypothetical protein